MKTIVKNGSIVTESGIIKADILIEGERVSSLYIGSNRMPYIGSDGTPGCGTSDMGTPGFGTSGCGISGLGTSDCETPGFGTSDCGISGFGTSGCEISGLGTSDCETPDVEISYYGELKDDDVQVIDAAGKYVLPGAVDVHTHMDLDVGFTRACDDFYTGTVAAACGGTTTIVDHMAFGPKGCSLWHQVEEYHRLADGKAVVDYGFHGVLQHVNSDILAEMKEIADAEGITSFKAYMTYADRLDDEALFQALRKAKEEGIVVAAHCENDGVINLLRKEYVSMGLTAAKYHPLSRPAHAEAEAVNRFLHLAAMAGDAPSYIVHLSSKEGLAEVMKARRERQQHVGVETCTQYLMLTDSFYEDPSEGLKAVMSPPLRRADDNEALWQALADGIIDVIGTDHCPFLFATQKQRGAEDFTLCPNGAPGVQERLNVIYSEGVAGGRITLPQLVRSCSANPARLFGLYPRKGTLQPGADADLVIFDPDREHVFYAKDIRGAADYSCYEGMKLKGAVETVMLRGKVIARDGNFCGSKGDGQYLKRGRSSLV